MIVKKKHSSKKTTRKISNNVMRGGAVEWLRNKSGRWYKKNDPNEKTTVPMEKPPKKQE